MDSDLAFASVEDLIVELQKRASTSLIVLQRPPKVTNGNDLHSVYYNGSFLAALGCCAYAENELFERADANAQAQRDAFDAEAGQDG